MNIQPTTLQITSLKGLPHIDFLPLLGFYDFENEKTLTSCLVISRKNNMKLGMQVVNFRNHYVVNDILATLFTGIKIFFELDTCLIKYTFTKHRKPLTTLGRKVPNFFYCARHLYYLSHRFMTHRNVKVRVLPKTKGYRDVSFFRRLRPLNRMLFFTLLLRLKSFSFRLPLWMTQRKWNSRTLQIYYIGFKVKIKPSTIARGVFRAIGKRKYLLSPFNVFPRCLTSRRYYHYLREWAVYYAMRKQQSFFKAFYFKRFVKCATMLANRAYSFANIRIRRNIQAFFVFNNKRLKSKLDEFAFWATQKWVQRRRKRRLLRPLENARSRLEYLIKGIKFNRDSLLNIKQNLLKRLNKIEKIIDGLKRAKTYEPRLGSRNRAIQTKNELRTYLYNRNRNRANLPMRFKLRFLWTSIRTAKAARAARVRAIVIRAIRTVKAAEAAKAARFARKIDRVARRHVKLARRGESLPYDDQLVMERLVTMRDKARSISRSILRSMPRSIPIPRPRPSLKRLRIRAHNTLLLNLLRTHHIRRTRAPRGYSRLLRSRLNRISPAVKGANMSMSRHRGAIIAALPKRKMGQLRSIRARYPRRIRFHLIQSNPLISRSNLYLWRRRFRDFYLRKRKIANFYYWISRMRSNYSYRIGYLKLTRLKRVRRLKLAHLKRVRRLKLARLKRIRYHNLKLVRIRLAHLLNRLNRQKRKELIYLTGVFSAHGIRRLYRCTRRERWNITLFYPRAIRRIGLSYYRERRRIRFSYYRDSRRIRLSYFRERRRIRFSYYRDRALIIKLHPAIMRRRYTRVDSVDIKGLHSMTKPRFRLRLTRWLYSSSKPRLIQKNFLKVINSNKRYRVKYYRRYRDYNCKPSIKPRRRLTRCFHKISKTFVNKVKYGSRRPYRRYFKIPSLLPSVKTRQGGNEDSYFTFKTPVLAILHKVFVMNNPSIKHKIKSKGKICRIYP
jgi:CRISPR/Cas system-associated exonuclease Cas4 (RecB family)